MKAVKVESRIMREIIEKYKEDYLTTILHKERDGELQIIYLFKCRICGVPIHYKQFAFCGNCGSCDVGKINPTWIIEKPKERRR